ncbi:hypothetical protein [Microbacterium sp. NPDC057650]|uniref:hypothetical protein n=1 Tax=unclassified Microbacterium TaxID=2609290 RepID=UPI0036707CB9
MRTDSGSAARRRLWPWILVLILAPIVVFLTFADQVGSCETPPPGSDSMGCTVGPAVGLPGAFFIGAVCVALFALAVIKVILRSRRRAGAA